MGSRAFGAFLGGIVCASLGLGCMEPLQSGGVMIVGDPGERIAAMCRFRHRDRVAELCGAEANGAQDGEASAGAFEDGDLEIGQEGASPAAGAAR